MQHKSQWSYFVLFLCMAMVLCSCSTAPLSPASTTKPDPHLPNFAWVDESQHIARGGQPDAEGFISLAAFGITNIVKLNTDFEGDDVLARALGMTMNYCPITFTEQLFTRPGNETVWRAVDAIGPGTYIHCEHGQDRTGLIIACWRWDHGTPVYMIEQEMLSHGFHKELRGLWHFWEKLATAGYDPSAP